MFWTIVIGTIVIMAVVELIASQQDKKPRRENFKTHADYEKALYKWEMANNPELMKKPLLKRLEWRGHTSSRGYYGDNLSYETCFICGNGRKEKETFCSVCQKLYENSPRTPLPEGIPESWRKRLWLYRQSVVHDAMEGLISEKQAAREIEIDAVEQVKADIRRPEIEAEKERAYKREVERRLQERMELTERLSRK